MRNSLSIAIVEIVVKKFSNESIVSGDICPPTDEDLITDDSMGGEYEWSEELQGLILSSFYFGFIVTNIPGD
jgi:ACS family sodium-dependent inorganic phosphate cotransporter